jgi:hypothetical protein
MTAQSQVQPERVLRWMLGIAAVLVAISVVVSALWTRYGYSARGLLSRFDLALDAAVPTFWSSAALTVGGLLAVALSRCEETRSGDRLRWRMIAVLLIGLGVDEVARFHEWLGDAIDVDRGGFFYYSWVYFGIALVVVVGAALLPFVLRQPKRLRTLLLLSAVLFVGGALLMEMVNANLEAQAGSDSLRYALQTAVEEALELAGETVLVFALLDELRRRKAIERLSAQTVSPERALRLMLAVVGVSVGASVIAYASIILGDFSARGLFDRFKVGSDSSVPTYISALGLACSAMLMWVIAQDEPESSLRRRWRVLGLILMAMAVDEVARLHEFLGDATDLGGDGVFYYTWVYFGIVLVVVVGAAFLPFVLKQPRRLRNLILLSAVIFVSGALVMEMLNANLESSVDEEAAERWAEFGTDSFRYAMQTVVEELFEMLGVAILIYALLDELRRRSAEWIVRF